MDSVIASICAGVSRAWSAALTLSSIVPIGGSAWCNSVKMTPMTVWFLYHPIMSVCRAQLWRD